LECGLEGAGGLADTPYGRNKYDQYLEWLRESDAEKKSMQFEKMSQGWALGGKKFRSNLLKEEKHMAAALELGTGSAREARELAWERRLKTCLKHLKKTPKDVSGDPKSAAWKCAIACHMKTKRLCSNGWLAETLSMGSESGVSKQAKRTLEGEPREAKQLLDELNSRIKE